MSYSTLVRYRARSTRVAPESQGDQEVGCTLGATNAGSLCFSSVQSVAHVSSKTPSVKSVMGSVESLCIPNYSAPSQGSGESGAGATLSDSDSHGNQELHGFQLF